ncbi:MAG: radical SAM protein [Thermoplasmata archaeon]
MRSGLEGKERIDGERGRMSETGGEAAGKMEVIYENGREGLARVFVARFRGSDRFLAEFVESLSGSPSREEKWVAILSSQFGCPVGCRFCDAGRAFSGNLTAEELLAQLDFLVKRNWPGMWVRSRKFKVQFARMGEPALNPAVLEAMERMSGRYGCPGLMPCVSTVAPAVSDRFFERLAELKHRLFDGSFQLQFSVHSTDERVRDWLIPVRKWGLERIASYGEDFHGEKGRKVTLNFALTPALPVDAEAIASLFDPAHFVVKLTPVNPTESALGAGLVSPLAPEHTDGTHPLVRELRRAGFEVIVTVGELEENEIRSNCGQLAIAPPTKRYI